MSRQLLVAFILIGVYMIPDHTVPDYRFIIDLVFAVIFIMFGAIMLRDDYESLCVRSWNGVFHYTYQTHNSAREIIEYEHSFRYNKLELIPSEDERVHRAQHSSGAGKPATFHTHTLVITEIAHNKRGVGYIKYHVVDYKGGEVTHYCEEIKIVGTDVHLLGGIAGGYKSISKIFW